MQLHSKSGFIFYNNFNSGIYYQTSGHENLLKQSYCNIALGSKAFIESITSTSGDSSPKKRIFKTSVVYVYINM